MNPTSVSAVIPAYKAESTIVETLDSILAQTSPVSEIIVVDDVSPDGTVAVIKRWQVDHPDAPLVLIEQPDNTGPAGARNTGVERATGEWIAFLDSDDAWLPEKTEVQLEAAKSSPAIALICGETRVLSHANEKERTGNEGVQVSTGRGVKPDNQVLTLADFVATNPVATSTVMVKKAAIDSVEGFDVQFRGPEDYDLWLRVVAQFPAVKVLSAISLYRYVPLSLSMDERTFLPQVLRVLDKAYGPGGVLEGRQGFMRQARAEQYCYASWMAFGRGSRIAALGYLARSWVTFPRRLVREQADPFFRCKRFFRYLVGPALRG